VLATLAGIEREPEGEVERKVSSFNEEAREAVAMLHYDVAGEIGELSGMTVFDKAGSIASSPGSSPSSEATA
jgi:hypothetical protein